MFTKSLLVKILCLIALTACLISCTPIAKLVTGVRNPKIYQLNEERLEYYKPFYEVQNNKISIYTLNDISSFQTAFDSLYVPRIYVQSNTTDSVYVLSCYEDVGYNIEDLNKDDFDELDTADPQEFARFKSFFEKQTKLTYTANESNSQREWDVYLVSGSFLGNKLRRRTLQVSSINNLNQIKVLDLSVNKE